MIAAGVDIKWYEHCGNGLAVSHKDEHALTIYHTVITLGYLFQKDGNLRSHKSCTGMFTAALFETVQNWRQSKCPSTGE